jgi:hypothetical protein
MAREVDVTNAKAGALQQRIQSPQQLMGDMLQDEQLFHVPIIVLDYNLARMVFEIGSAALAVAAAD